MKNITTPTVLKMKNKSKKNSKSKKIKKKIMLSIEIKEMCTKKITFAQSLYQVLTGEEPKYKSAWGRKIKVGLWINVYKCLSFVLLKNIGIFINRTEKSDFYTNKKNLCMQIKN